MGRAAEAGGWGSELEWLQGTDSGLLRCRTRGVPERGRGGAAGLRHLGLRRGQAASFGNEGG